MHDALHLTDLRTPFVAALVALLAVLALGLLADTAGAPDGTSRVGDARPPATAPVWVNDPMAPPTESLTRPRP